MKFEPWFLTYACLFEENLEIQNKMLLYKVNDIEKT